MSGKKRAAPARNMRSDIKRGSVNVLTYITGTKLDHRTLEDASSVAAVFWLAKLREKCNRQCLSVSFLPTLPHI